MDNTLQMINGKFVLNGVPVHNVTSYKLEPISGGYATEVTLTFDVPSSKPKVVNAKAEQPEEPHPNITIDDEKIGEIQISQLETPKSLYRDSLERQLTFLKKAQEDARMNGMFESVLKYSREILALSREIEDLDKLGQCSYWRYKYLMEAKS